MGESERYREYKKPKKQKFTLGQDGNALMSLIALNIVFFLVLLLVQVVYFFFQQTPEIYNAEVIQWFEVPASLTKLSERPWTILTYVFSDSGNHIMRILSNLIWISVFGHVFQEITGNTKLVPIYIYGGIAGAFVFILSHYLFPELSQQRQHAGLLGANTGTMAIAMATATLAPHHKFFPHIRGGVSLWIVLAIYVIIDIAGVKELSIAHAFAHIGGAAAGFLFIILLKRGTDLGGWMNNFYNWLMNLFNPYKKGKESASKKLFYNTGDRKPYEKRSAVTQQRVDDILDKINLRGYNSLTEEEKEILKKAAEEDL